MTASLSERLEKFEAELQGKHPEQIRRLHASLDQAITDRGGWSGRSYRDDEVGALIEQWGICRKVYEQRTGKTLW